MVILGLLLLAAAIVVGVEFGVSNLGNTGFEVFGTSMTASLATVFVLGAITMAIGILGTFMITGALQRRRTVRTGAKHREQIQATETKLGEYDRTTAELVEENDRLRAELTEERRAAATMGGVTVPPGTGDVAYGDQITDAVRSNTITDTGRFEPYPTTIDNTKFDDDHLRSDTVSTGTSNGVNGVNGNGTGGATGEEKAGVLGRFRGDNR